MKKIFASMMAAAMVVSLAGCSNGNSSESSSSANSEGGSDNAAAYKLGMGVVTSTASSAAGNAQVDATVAAVVLDADGKIVSCAIDVAQNKMDVTDGEVPEDAASMTFKSKKEKLEEYGMKPASAIGKEWYEHSEGYCSYLKGKTEKEVADIPADGSDADLAALCTISIDALQKAVGDAFENGSL